MNVQQVIQQSELLNRLVLERRTAEEVGRVNELWLNLHSHQVVGFTCKSGILGSKKRSFAWGEIESIGTDSILVNLNQEANDPAKPDPISSVIGHELWTDAGNKAGKVVDYLFVPQTGAVVSYLFVSSGWRGMLDGMYLLPIAAIASVGSKRVIVADAAIQEPQQYTQGLGQKVGQAAEFIKEDLEKTRRDLESVKRGTQGITEQIKDKAQAATGKAKEITEQVKDKAQAATEQAKKITEQVKDQAQAATDKAKEKLSEIKAKQQSSSVANKGDNIIEIEVESFPPEEQK